MSAARQLKRYGRVGVHTQLSLNCRFTGKFGKTDPSPTDQTKYHSEERCALRTKLLGHAQRCIEWQKLRELAVIRAELVLGDRAKTALLPQLANVEQAQQLNAMSRQLDSLQKSQNAGFPSVQGAEAADDIKQAVASAVNFAKVEDVASRIEITVGTDVADGEDLDDLEDRLLRILELLSSKKATDGFKRVRPMSDLRIPVKIIFWLAHLVAAGNNNTQRVYKKGYDVLAGHDVESRVCVVVLRFLIQQLHRLGQADFKFQVNLLRAPTCRMNFSSALGTGTRLHVAASGRR